MEGWREEMRFQEREMADLKNWFYRVKRLRGDCISSSTQQTILQLHRGHQQSSFLREVEKVEYSPSEDLVEAEKSANPAEPENSLIWEHYKSIEGETDKCAYCAQNQVKCIPVYG